MLRRKASAAADLSDSDASVAAAPAGLAASVQEAADILDQDFTNNITISIRYGWGTFDNAPDGGIPATGAEGGPLDETTVTYAQLRTALLDKPTLPGDLSILGALPNSTAAFPDGDSNFTISSAEEKALGLLTGNPDLIDGAIGFGTRTSPDFWVEGALHEITHALGRVIGSVSDPTVFDLYPLCGDPAVRMDERAAGLFFDRRRRDGACQFRFDF